MAKLFAASLSVVALLRPYALGSVVALLRPHALGSVVALLRPHALGFTGFRVVFLLLEQNRKHKVVHVLTYLPPLGITVRPNEKSGCVPGNSVDHFQLAI
jgi:hypothetical protein